MACRRSGVRIPLPPRMKCPGTSVRRSPGTFLSLRAPDAPTRLRGNRRRAAIGATGHVFVETEPAEAVAFMVHDVAARTGEAIPCGGSACRHISDGGARRTVRRPCFPAGSMASSRRNRLEGAFRAPGRPGLACVRAPRVRPIPLRLTAAWWCRQRPALPPRVLPVGRRSHGSSRGVPELGRPGADGKATCSSWWLLVVVVIDRLDVVRRLRDR